MKHLRRLKNLIFCRSWSFYISSIEHSRAVARQGDTVYINGIVCNDGIRLGSAYIVVKIADPYNYSRIAFDSHRDLEFERRQALRVIDLNVGDVFRFSVPWIIDTNIVEGVYYYRAELWNIPRLFRKEPRLSRFWNYCFDRTPWTPAVEIISPKSDLYSEIKALWWIKTKKEIGQKAKQTVIDNFSMDKLVDNYKQLIGDLIKEEIK